MARWTNKKMLTFLRGERGVGATSLQMGHDRSWLTKKLSGPEATLPPQQVAAIMDAFRASQEGVA